MNNLIMTNYLFHGFKPCRFDYREINTLGYDKIIIDDSSKILKEVLDAGYILPRCDLKNFLSHDDYQTLKKQKLTNWNGENKISICEHIEKTTNLYEKVYNSDISRDLIDQDFAYDIYINQYPSLILDSRLLNELKVCLDPYRTMPGEIQIEERIPIEYIVGVALPHVKLIKDLPNIIKSVIFHNNKDLDDKMMFVDLVNMNEEEFVKKYYYDVIKFEQILRLTDSNLKLYSKSSGTEIISSDNMIKCVKAIKKKYI